MRIEAKLGLVVFFVVSAVSPRTSAQAPAEPGLPNQSAPIVIPPATIGLAAAPEELQQALDESVLPHTVPELLDELAKRAAEIQQTITSGAYGQVWVPAMGTKTVALVLESHADAFPVDARTTARTAIKAIVTSAWELDTYGDLGNREKLDAAYARLSRGVSNLKGAYGSR